MSHLRRIVAVAAALTIGTDSLAQSNASPFEQCKRLKLEGKLDGALARCEAAVNVDAAAPNQVEMLTLTGDIALELERYTQAVGFYTRALVRSPNDVPALMGRAEALYSNKDHGAALPALDQVLALEPRHAHALHLRGHTRHILASNAKDPGDGYARAAADFEAAAALDPTIAHLWYDGGLAWHRARRSPEAFDAFSKALALEPSHRDARVGRAVVSAALEDWFGVYRDFSEIPEAEAQKDRELWPSWQYSLTRFDEAYRPAVRAEALFAVDPDGVNSVACTARLSDKDTTRYAEADNERARAKITAELVGKMRGCLVEAHATRARRAAELLAEQPARSADLAGKCAARPEAAAFCARSKKEIAAATASAEARLQALQTEAGQRAQATRIDAQAAELLEESASWDSVLSF